MSDVWGDYEARTRGQVAVRLDERLGDILSQEPVWVHEVYEGADGDVVRLVIATGGSAHDVAVKVVAEAAGLDSGSLGLHTRTAVRQVAHVACAAVGAAMVAGAMASAAVSIGAGLGIVAVAAASWVWGR